MTISENHGYQGWREILIIIPYSVKWTVGLIKTCHTAPVQHHVEQDMLRQCEHYNLRQQQLSWTPLDS